MGRCAKFFAKFCPSRPKGCCCCFTCPKFACPQCPECPKFGCCNPRTDWGYLLIFNGDEKDFKREHSIGAVVLKTTQEGCWAPCTSELYVYLPADSTTPSCRRKTRLLASAMLLHPSLHDSKAVARSYFTPAEILLDKKIVDHKMDDGRFSWDSVLPFVFVIIIFIIIASAS